MSRSQASVPANNIPLQTNVKSSLSGSSSKSRYLYYALLLLIVVFFGFIRFRLRDMPLERDEGEFAYGGQLLLQGASLYEFVYTVKLPGTHAAYALLMGVLGQTQGRIHVGLLVVNAATTLLVFFLCRRLFGSLAGIVAAASYALLSTSPSVAGFAGHATHFVVFFALSGVLVLLKAVDSERNRLFFWAGLSFGIAFLMKQPGAAFLCWALVYLAWITFRQSAKWNRFARWAAALLVGGVLPFAATCLWIWRSGSFGKFWFWTFRYAREYGTNVTGAEGLTFLGRETVHVTEPAVWVWALAVVGLSTFIWCGRVRSSVFFATSFTLFSFLALSAGLYFRPHYFILFLPAVSMLAGLAVSCGVEGLQRWKGSRTVSAIPVVIFLLAFGMAVYQQREFLFQMAAIQACEHIYRPNPFPEALEISNYINSNASPNAKIAVIGSEPEIYFYTQRRSANGYIYTYPLLEPQKYALTMQKEMEAEIEKARPEVLVLVNNPKSWVAWNKTAPTDEILAWANGYIRQHYVVDGLAERGDKTKYYWGVEARDHQLASQLYVYVLKRKPA